MNDHKTTGVPTNKTFTSPQTSMPANPPYIHTSRHSCTQPAAACTQSIIFIHNPPPLAHNPSYSYTTHRRLHTIRHIHTQPTAPCTQSVIFIHNPPTLAHNPSYSYATRRRLHTIRHSHTQPTDACTQSITFARNPSFLIFAHNPSHSHTTRHSCEGRNPAIPALELC